MTRQFEKNADKAIKNKAKLNYLETIKGKKMAIAGYLEKKKKLEKKLASGKITMEEFDDQLKDLDEDVTYLKGGEEGLSQVSDQYTYDKEALTLVGKIKKEHRSNLMNDMVEDIYRRNSKVVPKVVEATYQDPKQVKAKIKELIKEGKKEEANALADQLKKMIEARKKYIEFAEATGQEVDTPRDVKPEELNPPTHTEETPEMESDGSDLL